jgi:type IV pilus assembly protein PilW
MSAPGRPKRDCRSAQHEGRPVSPRHASRMRGTLRQGGMTLVELMIGLALSLLIVLALLTLLINVNRNNAELSRTNSVIENGRFAQQLIQADLVHAGFWGGLVPTFDDLSITASVGSTTNSTTIAFPTALPDPCADVSTWTATYKGQLIAIPLQVYQVSSAGISPICPTIITTATAQPNTDILVVRHAAPCPAVAGGTDTDCQNTAGNMFFQASRCPNDTARYVLSATAADLVLRSANCTAAAPMYRFISTIYWVRNYFTTAGDGIPTLVRTRFQLAGGTLAHQSTETLVDGVQDLRVQIGVDNVSKPTVAGGTGTTLTTAMFQADVGWSSPTAYYTPTKRGDGNVDTWLTCASAGTSPCSDATQGPFNLANTVAARINILARASSQTPDWTDTKHYTVGGDVLGPYNDRYKRHVYTQTVRLNNVSMRREVPPP